MGELKIEAHIKNGCSYTTIEHPHWGGDVTVTYYHTSILGPGKVRVNYSSVGELSSESAKAFHAALGKAIEIAEGYQRELEGSNE